MKKLLILGAGGYGRTIADVARQLGCYQKIAFLDDAQAGIPGVLGTCEDFLQFADADTEIYPAFGNNATRMSWIERLENHELAIATLVHPSAYVSPTVILESGVAVLPKAIVNTGATVKAGCIINIGAVVDHDVVMERGSHAAPGAIIKAENRIPAEMKVESGTIVENRYYPL